MGIFASKKKKNRSKSVENLDRWQVILYKPCLDIYPVDTGTKLNVHKTSIWHPERSYLLSA